MTKDNDFELVHGSGNVFRDFGRADADLQQAKALMASEIIRILEDRQWTTRKAEEVTGISHADFSRIRRVNLGRFTLDRLMTILAKLGQEVEVSVSIRPRPADSRNAPAVV
jgi:predicted XRE-type DNA-binding protein